MSSSYDVELERTLAERLEEAARNAKLSAAQLIAECVIQHLDVAIRHRALLERLDSVDQGLLDLAEFIGQATADSPVDLSKLCRCPQAKA